MKPIILFIAFLITQIGPSLQAQQISQNITVLQADSLIKAKSGEKNLVILDIRTEMEIKTGLLEKAKTLNYLSWKERKEIWKLDNNKAYVIYCQSGVRSGKLLKKMKRREFREVYNMLGGIKAWKEQGLPTQDPRRKTQEERK